MNKITLLFPALVFTVTIAFLTACSSSPLKPAQSKSTLNIEAAIIYKMDGVKPVARENFYLLDTSAEEILKSANLKPQSEKLDRYLKMARGRGMEIDTLHYLDFLSLALASPKEYAPYLLQVTDEMKKHTVKAVTTDLQGKAQFDSIEPKTYYIFGMTQTRADSAIWNLPIEIKSEQQSIILDQNNAVRAE